jgi:aminocarboxymuconate-semialdehyde decarboxylase
MRRPAVPASPVKNSGEIAMDDVASNRGPAKVPAIDTHTHFLPPSAVGPAERNELWHGIQFGHNALGRITSSVGDRTQEIPWPMPLETPAGRLKTMDSRRVDRHVLSISPTMYWHSLGHADASAFARVANDDLAAIISEAPDRYSGLGFLPLQDTEGSVKELERCVRDLGFKGAMVCTHVNGVDWDDPSLFPVLEAAAALGAVVYYHPGRGRADSWMKKYHLRNLIGNPLETTVTLASLIFGGVYDKLPDLKTCFSHAGGYGVLGVGRFDHGHEVRPEASAIAQLPSDYVRRIWVDTITHSERTLRYIVDTVGADRVVLGSDYPADMGEPRPVDFVESCESLSDAEKTAILGANAARLFGIEAKAAV